MPALLLIVCKPVLSHVAALLVMLHDVVIMILNTCLVQLNSIKTSLFLMRKDTVGVLQTKGKINPIEGDKKDMKVKCGFT